MSFRSVMHSVLASGTTAALGMVSGLAVARGLGPSMRGELAAVVGWTGTIASVLDLGLGFAAGYFAGKEPRRAPVLLSQILTVAAGLGVICYFLAAVVVLPHLALKEMPRGVQLWLLLGIPISMAAGYVAQISMGLGHISASNGTRLVASAFYAATTVGLVFWGYRELAGYAFANLGTQAILLVLGLAWLLRSGRLSLMWPGRSGLANVLRYGLRTQLASLAAQLNLRLDQLVMSIVLPSEALGQYVVAVALAAMPMPLFSGIAVAATPRIIAATDTKQGALRGLRFLALGVAFAGLTSIFLISIAEPIITLLFGAEYHRAVAAGRILLGASVFQGCNLLLGTVLRGIGRPAGPAVGELSGTIVTVSLLPVLIPRYGILGAAGTSLAAYFIATVVLLVLLIAGAKLSLRAVFADWFGTLFAVVARRRRTNLR
ncbi:MAG: oligosaccharide flippase family protein [Polyangiaceae bacterium]